MSDKAGNFALIFEDVCFGYGSEYIIKNLNGAIRCGEIFLIIGPNSSGKTTLAKLCVRLLSPQQGRLIVSLKNIEYIPQQAGLISNRTAYENLVIKLRYFQDYAGEKAVEEEVNLTVKRFGLEPYRDKLPAQLSAGIQKRIAIARAILSKPDLIIVDSLTQEVDTLEGIRTLALLRQISKEMALTIVLFAGHIEPEIRIADRVAILQDGKFQYVGTPEDIFSSSNIWINEILNAERALGKCRYTI